MSSNSAPIPQLLEPLTHSEKNVLTLMAQGMSDKEISIELNIAPITVRGNHKQAIYDKLGLEKPHRSKRWAIFCARTIGLLKDDGDDDMLPPIDIDNPYKGLDAFQQEDAHLFFGRETFIETLLQRVGKMNRKSRFLALVGASGSGKSSVIRAGLIPALIQNRVAGASQWHMETMFPRVNPYYELEIALKTLTNSARPDLLDLLRRDAYGLVRVCDLIFPKNKPLLLVIDQFEEIFTLVQEEQVTRDFLDMLTIAATDPRSQVRIIITIRADFLDKPLMIPKFSWLMQENTVMMVPMTPEETERAIVMPARQARVDFDQGVVARLVAETNQQPGALPLLEFALAELYDNRIGNKITEQSYDYIGGLHQALASQADQIFEWLTPEEQEAARQLFLRLITLGDGTKDVRRRVPMSELRAIDDDNHLLEEVAHFLAGNRLLTIDMDYQLREATVEVAHEALISEWDLLRDWLDEARADIRLERLLRTQVAEWQAHDRSSDFLMRGGRLAQFADFREKTTLILTELQHAFIDASLNEQERLEQIEHERLEHEHKLRLLAQSSSLALAAEKAIENQKMVLATMLAVESAKLTDELLPETLRVLERISTMKGPKFYLEKHDTRAGPIMSPDGRFAITHNFKDFAVMWDVTTGERIQTFSADDTYFGYLRLNIDNSLLFTMHKDGQHVSVWDTQSGVLTNTLKVTPDGEDRIGVIPLWHPHLIVAIMHDPSVQQNRFFKSTNIYIYNVLTGERLYHFFFEDIHYCLCNFSADGRLGIISGWADDVARDIYCAYVFDVETGQIIETYQRPVDIEHPYADEAKDSMGPTSIGFGDDMTKIYMGGYPNYIIDRASNENIHVIDDAPMVFIQQLTEVVVLHEHQPAKAYLLDTQTGDVTYFGIFHSAPVMGHDRYTVLSGMNNDPDHCQIWDLHHRNANDKIVVQIRGWSNVEFSPDGTLIAVVEGWHGSPSTTSVHVHNHITGELLYKLTDDVYDGYDLDWSSDGHMLAVGTVDGTVLILEAVTGNEIHRLTDIKQGHIGALQFSSDNRYLVAAHGVADISQAYNVPPSFIVWNTRTGEVVNQVVIHDDAENWGIFSLSLHPTEPIAHIVVNYWSYFIGYVVNIFTGEILYTIPRNQAGDALFTHDGKYLVIAPALNSPIYVRDTQTGEIVRQWKTLESSHDAITLSPDGKYLATLSGPFSSEAVVTLWDFETGKLLRRFVRYDEEGFSSDIDFSPDGKKLVSCVRGGIIILNVDPTPTLDWVLQNRAVREFTDAERELYRIDPPTTPEAE